MDDLSAKVFRTYNASVTLQEELEAALADVENPDVKVKFYNDCNRKVAILCNH
jgi:DNA topoisomerase I